MASAPGRWPGATLLGVNSLSSASQHLQRAHHALARRVGIEGEHNVAVNNDEPDLLLGDGGAQATTLAWPNWCAVMLQCSPLSTTTT